MESHISFPVLSFYRSQHENQSWVQRKAHNDPRHASALLLAGVDGPDGYQARLTFAMARHVAVDLAMIFGARPLPPQPERLSPADFGKLRETLCAAGLKNCREGLDRGDRALAELRALYEPFVNSLAAYFLITLPPFYPSKPPVDNWQTSPWTPRSPGLGGLPTAGDGKDHFD